MTVHAKLSASGSHRWLACPGSVKAEEGLKDKGSSFAQEGTCAHELAELALSRGQYASDWVGLPLVENNDFTVTVEMAGYVQNYVDYVKMIGGYQEYECRVDFGDWVPDGFGTSDVIAYDKANRHLHIVDLKYGKGVRVDADENTQGILYALGAYFEWGYIHHIETITLHIVQPRLDHISTWSLSRDDLMLWGERIRQGAERCLDDDAERVPGEKQCTFCKAKATCPALHRHAEQAMLADFDSFTPTSLDKVTDDQMRKALEAKKLIIGWLDAVEAHITSRLEDGDGFPGFKLVAGRSLRQWGDDTTAESTLVDLLGDGAYSPRKILSVAQAEKALGSKGAKKVAELIIKPAGRPTLVADSDPRPALGCTSKDFDF